MKDHPKLGLFCTTDAARDAVHIAILPMFSKDTLNPGQWVALVAGKQDEVRCLNGNELAVGVVDPFLKSSILPGATFWLCLLPGSITALRHDWTHPSFVEQPVRTTAIERITAFANTLGWNYDSIMWRAKEYLKDGEYVNVGNLENMELPATFWDDFQEATGIQVIQENRGSFFSCNCT